MYLIGATVHTMTGAIFSPGVIEFDGGVILRVGPPADFSIPEGAQVLDFSDCHATPGLIDPHCHLGMFVDGADYDVGDCNENTDPITPHLRGIDGLPPRARCFRDARRAGSITVDSVPGSTNPIAGQLAAIKTAGRRVEDMVVKCPLAMKFALGENPKNCYGSRGVLSTRMGIAAAIREALTQAQSYAAQKAAGHSSAPDAKWEALLPVLTGELPAHFHVHRGDDIATALRLSREFGLKPVLIHCTEGYHLADLLAETGVPAVVGPIINDRGKPELAGLREDNGAILHRAGIPVAVCTDHPETPIHYLALSAALCGRNGMDPEEALACITARAAEICGIADRVGTLEPGKDADFAVFRGPPLELTSTVVATLIGGKQSD